MDSPAKLHHIIVLVFSLLLTSFSVNAEKPLTLGIHPYKSPHKLLRIYKPLADHLSKQLNRPVNISIAKDYDTHIQQIGMNKLDIAYLGPASYVKLVNQFGKKPILARQAINQKPTFQGKIIVRENSAIGTIEDLKGKRFAFGDPNSTMSHLVPRFMLIKKGVTASNLKRLDFLGSHDNVALGVLSGDYDAGAVKEAVYYKYKPRGIKALATTPALSEHLFVAGNHLSKKLTANIKHIFLNLKNNPDGLKAMMSIKKKMTGMVPATDADYDNLREILDTLKRHNIIQ